MDLLSKQNRDKVSIIISTFREVCDGDQSGNRSTFQRALASVLSQTYANWELFVIADGVDSSTLQKLEKVIARYQDPRISLYNLAKSTGADRPGVGPKKYGISKAIGNYLAFLDADNVWNSSFLEECINILENSKEIDLAYTDSIVRRSDDFLGTCTQFFWDKPEFTEKRKYQLLNQFNFIDMSEVVLRKDAYDESNGFVNQVPQSDLDLWRSLIASHRSHFHHISYPGLIYYTHTWKRHFLYCLFAVLKNLNVPINTINYREKHREHYALERSIRQRNYAN